MTDIPAKIRAAVYERDGRCRMCGTTNAYSFEIHHIEFRSQRKIDQHTLDNLVLLCGDHHRLVHTEKLRYQDILKEIVSSGKPITGFQLIRWTNVKKEIQ